MKSTPIVPAVIAARFVGGFPGQIEVGGFERL